jgi:putative peptide zinc metalloprotease protein
MTGPIFSASWYRVEALVPRLRAHVRIHRQEYRGQTWYILQDPSTERFHRFSPPAYFIIGLMDGRRTVREVWETTTARLGDDAPTQDEVIHLLSQLHGADALQCDVPPDTAELLDRYDRQRRRTWQSRLFSVFGWRASLFDPERLLQRLLPLVRPLFGWPGAVLCLAVVGPALVLAASHWGDLTANVMDRVLAPQNLVLLWLSFPLLKILHEFGHAFAVKVFGGEVHDMGIMLLVLTPVPYVDASSAWAFRDKWRRIAVGAAGMAVELFVAALALFVWLNAEPGMVRTVAYNAVFLAGTSTILFNANPLLRFDGYYILMDLLEIPNLRSRATGYIGYLCERYLFGRREAEVPVATPGERAWFVAYGIASFVYRILIAVAIILFIAGKFFVVGVLLAALAAIAWGAVPAAKGVAYLVASPRLRRVRTRAVAVSTLVVAALVVVTCLVPVPLRSRAEGVVWLPDEAFVRAGTEGFVARVAARPGSPVRAGDVLIECRDPVLAAQVAMLEARVRELEARYDEQRLADLVKAQMIKEDLQYAAESLAQARRRAAELVIRSGADGTFVAPFAEDLPGRFVRKGELLGHVADPGPMTVRVVVPQATIDLVRHRTAGVQVRLAERVADILPAAIAREVPAATEQLPTAALGSAGGGQVAVDPRDARGLTAVQTHFQFDLALATAAPGAHVGGRVHVRFEHGWEPLVARWYRQVRQLFLSRFNV